jgi:hypothetical protein
VNEDQKVRGWEDNDDKRLGRLEDKKIFGDVEAYFLNLLAS